MQMHSFPPGRLFRFVARFPRTIVVVSLLLSVISTIYTKQSMEYLTGRDDLMPKNRKFYLDNAAYNREFGGPDDIVVVIESGDREQAALFGQRLERSSLITKKSTPCVPTKCAVWVWYEPGRGSSHWEVLRCLRTS